MKAQKKFIAALIGINIMAFAAIPSVITKANTDYTTIDNLVNQAISEQNLYHYNVAYKRIMDLPEGYEKDVLLSRLASIADSVWTRDIKELVQLIDVMAKEKSGRAYDALEAKINKSGIKEIDKQYLYNELYGWGKNTVWTDDYKKAIAAVIKVWNDKTDVSSLEAEKAVEELKVQINKEYIIEQLKEARIGVGLLPFTLDSKYFEGKADTAYVENGKSIILDLSKDTKERTVTLKGKFRMLNINAPLATVILEDVDANEITLEDVSNHSLYLKGDTKVQSLIVNDKSDNARIVLQGKASVVSAEVKSGAKNIVITVDQDGKIQELNANTALKVEGTGTLEKVTGPASSEVINTLPKTPGTGGIVIPGGGTGTIPGGNGGNGNTVPTEDKTAPSINTIFINTAGGTINIQPGKTGVINLSQLIKDSAVQAVTSADVTLNTDLQGQNNTDNKENVTAILDCTNSGSSTLKSYIGKKEGKLNDIQIVLEIGLGMMSSITSDDFKKISGTTLTLTDALGNMSFYTIIVQ